MARVLLVVDPSVGVSPSDLVKAWTPAPPVVDGAVVADGAVAVEAVRGRVMLPGVLEVLVLPVAVNLASSALFELVRSWVARARGPAAQDAEFEVVETTDDQGNRVVVVRPRRTV
ncbi:hypothetical protein FF36_05713 [Frankia torreyi]|uniref:Uncharacterized protein n=1 Tax=Frankia torreyi TaxID=1856 RepID=A0A0D8B740_9ACTN|nr:MULTISPECIES: hypothetical protein [Frankia]KJE19996.1 hypothetical protein FF36_05713 [Frankia torreyi]KQC37012.1 hypothetical protein UK82_17485 [Frankia sp. ACN1ag]